MSSRVRDVGRCGSMCECGSIRGIWQIAVYRSLVSASAGMAVGPAKTRRSYLCCLPHAHADRKQFLQTGSQNYKERHGCREPFAEGSNKRGFFNVVPGLVLAPGGGRRLSPRTGFGIALALHEY